MEEESVWPSFLSGDGGGVRIGIRDGVGLVFQFAAIFGPGDDVEVDGAVF